MATTRESIEDGLRWMLDLLRIGVRATAPEHVDACELERRETSEIDPPT